MWNKDKSLWLSIWTVRALLLALFVGLVFLPHLLSGYLNYTARADALLPPLLTALYASAASALVVLLTLGRLLRNIKNDRIFVSENVKLLRIISWCCFGVAVIFAGIGFVFIFSFIVATAALFFALILRVLKNVFADAVALKAENDYTI